MSSTEAGHGDDPQGPGHGNLSSLGLWINARCPPKYLENMVADFKPRLDSATEPPSGRWQIGDETTRRLVIIGDVHGHLEELQKLLKDIGFDKNAGDHAILVGDLVNKGPDSAGVVQFAMDTGLHVVLGNNDERTILAARFLKRNQPQKPGAVEGCSGEFVTSRDNVGGTTDTKQSQSPASHIILRNLVERDYKTAATLTEEQIAWLSSLPLIIRIGSFTNATEAPWNAGSVIVVHAGLVPGLALEEQDPWAVMNMRSLVYPDDDKEKENIRAAIVQAARDRIRGRTSNCPITDDEVDLELAQLGASEPGQNSRNKTIPLEGNDGDSWSDAWNLRQNLLQAPRDRAVVVYGHDAPGGLRVESTVEFRENHKEGAKTIHGVRYAFGLDSGCVYGRQLSALVIETGPGGKGVAHRIVQVDCINTKPKET